MADTKISALTAATAMANENEFAINEAGTSKKLTGTLMKDWAGNILRKVSTAAQSPGAGATTYLTNSNIAVPAALLRAGTHIRWRFAFSKTGAGTAARSFLVKIGTAGTTSDATIATLTSGTPTGVSDQGFQEIIWTLRTTGAAATSHAASHAVHQLSTTGLFANETEVLLAAGSTFDSTTANLIVGLAVTTGASEALTFEQLTAEALNL